MDNQKVVPTDQPNDNEAVELIRHKIEDLYNDEPSAKQELQEAESAGKQRSKHQQFMVDLSRSGKSLAEIQTAWHTYYVALPDSEKHKVWQEFYDNYGQQTLKQETETAIIQSASHTPHSNEMAATSHPDPRTEKEVKAQLLGKVQTRRKLQTKHHLQSLIFGLSMGAIVVLILLFGFFNERFIAPLITPSRNVSSTPIVIDPSTTGVGNEPKIIIPKINVELPVVYTEPSIEEKAVQNALESGVLHYATTPNPGEKGNGVIFGHSSNNILNHGKYKFAFVLLKRLEVGDTFMLEKDGKRYVYKVYDKKIVKPADVSVLSTAGKESTFTLITCDPPGTSLNRLVVIGEQISPDPAKNTQSSAKTAPTQPKILPSNSQSLWQRIWDWASN